ECHPEEAPDALRGPGAPGTRGAGGQAPRRHDHPAVGLLLRQRRDLRAVRGVGPRLRRVRPAEPLRADQRPDHGAPDHGRRAQARLRQADHGRHAVLGLRAPGQEAPRPRADLRAPGRRPVQDRGRRPDHGRRPAHLPDPGLLRRPGRPPVRAARARPLRQAHLRRPRPRRRLPRLRPRAPGRALGRHARRHPAGVHPQDPRPAQAERGRREPGGRRGVEPHLRRDRRHDRHRRHGGQDGAGPARRGCSGRDRRRHPRRALRARLRTPRHVRRARGGLHRHPADPRRQALPGHDGALHRPAAGPGHPPGLRRRLGHRPVRRQRL
ncbi:MAG: Ribose-phosphate pyrophosphokinase, partial [uncultured Pseudonocardia sp.]